MAFPLSSAGELRVALGRGCDMSHPIREVEAALRKARACPVDADSHRITFRARVWRTFMQWNALVAVSSGEITFHLDRGEALIRYRVSHLDMLILTVVLVFAGGTLLPFFGGTQPIPFLALLFGWCWIFGCNYLQSRYGFPRLLRAAVERGLEETVAQHAERSI